MNFAVYVEDLISDNFLKSISDEDTSDILVYILVHPMYRAHLCRCRREALPCDNDPSKESYGISIKCIAISELTSVVIGLRYKLSVLHVL